MIDGLQARRESDSRYSFYDLLQLTGTAIYRQVLLLPVSPPCKDGFAAASQKKTDLGKVLAGVYEENEAQKEDLNFFHEF